MNTSRMSFFYRTLYVRNIIKRGGPRPRKRVKRKKVKKHKTVKFFQGLGREKTVKTLLWTRTSIDLYRKFTRTVRQQMQEDGTWPRGAQPWTQETVMAYLRHLQVQFWNETGLKWKGKNFAKLQELWDKNRDEVYNPNRILIYIADKIRQKMVRQKVCRVGPVRWTTACVSLYAHEWTQYAWQSSFNSKKTIEASPAK